MSWLIHRWLLTSLLMFKGCRSLFLRHTRTGKCITRSEELVYNNPNHALPYFVVMTDNCLDDKAQFRYLDSELLHNIEKEGTLISSPDNNYHSRWAVYNGVASGAKKYQENVNLHRIKQTDAESLLFYDTGVCAEPSTKYVLRKTNCDTEKQKVTFGSVTAYNVKMEDVHCSPIQLMMVKSAANGDFNKNGAFNDDENFGTTCSKLTNCQVKSLCGGKRSCELTMDNNLLPSEYCSDTLKEIYTKYTCVDTYSSSTITTAPIIRLSHRNEGYIEIKDGSTWRKVVEENWDKNRQKMLCQHLGFEETANNSISIRQLGSGQRIATGDLICYNTPSGTSCCVHLQPSTSTSSFTIPDVQCKICDKPLLHDEGNFPGSVFSGSGDSINRYKDARITKGGWCPSGSGTKYLMLDLQNEYHITQVVVMANKEQTKWSGSYSLKYSHDKTLVNGSSGKQITGNQNGYQASIASLNIYNVRYMKIESTANPNYCLRIELCGAVQTPAPVYDIEITPSDYSVSVKWKIRTAPQDSSYIAHYLIYLNGDFLKNISRATYETQYNILQLKPFTKYTVGIETEDGSSQRGTYVTKTFTTKQAETVNPISVPISYSSLNVTIAKPPTYIKEVMIIVQIATKNPTPVENIETSDLQPYQFNTDDPYVTAYLKADVLPLTFVIGDGNEYNSEIEKYFNQRLKLNSSYIVFLRFFESQGSYYSTEWSSNVKTMIKAPVECDNNQISEESNDENSKIRMDLLIPLAILVLCFLLSLGVNIYQRRLIQINNRHPCHKCEISELQANRKMKFDHPIASSNKTMKGVRAAPNDSYMNDDTAYESPDYVIESIERNEAESRPEISTGQNIPDPPSSNKMMKGVRAVPNDSYMNDDTAYESTDYVIECIERNEAESKPEISTGQESSTYTSLKDNREPGYFYQSLQPPGTSADPHHTKGGG